MSNYLREHSAGSILSSTFEIYGKHFLKVVMIYFLPAFPAKVFQQEAERTGSTALTILAYVISFPVTGLAYAATAVALSDVCLGNKISVTRAYGKVLGPLVGKLLLTNLLQVLLIMLGLVLIIPGVLFFVWFFFTGPVVVLEGKWGRAALKRSKDLGKGFHLRNAGVFVVMIIVMAAIGGVIGAVFGALFSEMVDSWVFRMLLAILETTLSVPVSFICLVLMYYDMRVRKEAYDSVALAQELRH